MFEVFMRFVVSIYVRFRGTNGVVKDIVEHILLKDYQTRDYKQTQYYYNEILKKEFIPGRLSYKDIEDYIKEIKEG